MSLMRWLRLLARARFPRVSGDEPDVLVVYTFTIGFSPRERG